MLNRMLLLIQAFLSDAEFSLTAALTCILSFEPCDKTLVSVNTIMPFRAIDLRKRHDAIS
ncbi:hypothetical protein EBAPG3_005590 [Nitrosospira lacus]|uniref:Uncharacterized protein n=1 Tax=Nitrosospira lacus TaxID=1288494 RepID=A0A1W6SNA6_9PROT|nr:hypothetical protein EBAPG3_005590 [Nitrosospira lacus]